MNCGLTYAHSGIIRINIVVRDTHASGTTITIFNTISIIIITGCVLASSGI